MTTIAAILAAIASVRAQGAQHIRLTVSPAILSELERDKHKAPKHEKTERHKRRDKRRARHKDPRLADAVLEISGCHVFVADQEGWSMSWRK